jgi:hypothetical protein
MSCRHTDAHASTRGRVHPQGGGWTDKDHVIGRRRARGGLAAADAADAAAARQDRALIKRCCLKAVESALLVTHPPHHNHNHTHARTHTHTHTSPGTHTTLHAHTSTAETTAVLSQATPTPRLPLIPSPTTPPTSHPPPRQPFALPVTHHPANLLRLTRGGLRQGVSGVVGQDEDTPNLELRAIEFERIAGGARCARSGTSALGSAPRRARRARHAMGSRATALRIAGSARPRRAPRFRLRGLWMFEKGARRNEYLRTGRAQWRRDQWAGPWVDRARSAARRISVSALMRCPRPDALTCVLALSRPLARSP